jgi:hypothetical protein
LYPVSSHGAFIQGSVGSAIAAELPVSSLTYRPGDQFQERLNSERLKELFNFGDYHGLLEFALLLNHQASFNNSRACWALSEAAQNMAEEFSLSKYEKILQERPDQ